MKTLRINLHIRCDIHEELYKALEILPPKPRAEYLRKLAQNGLQITKSMPHSNSVTNQNTNNNEFVYTQPNPAPKSPSFSEDLEWLTNEAVSLAPE